MRSVCLKSPLGAWLGLSTARAHGSSKLKNVWLESETILSKTHLISLFIQNGLINQNLVLAN